MKKIIFLIAVVIACTQAFSQTAATEKAAPNPNAPKAKFDKMVNDFGEIAQGIPRTAEFKLTNEGKEPLLIQNARASCGCTNLKYSQEPILPVSLPLFQPLTSAAVGLYKDHHRDHQCRFKSCSLQIKGTVAKKKRANKSQHSTYIIKRGCSVSGQPLYFTNPPVNLSLPFCYTILLFGLTVLRPASRKAL
jgi:hypothetical protein